MTEIGELIGKIESGTVLSRVQIREGEATEPTQWVKVLLPKTMADGVEADRLEEIQVASRQLAAGKIRLAQAGDIVVKLTTPYDVAYMTESLAGVVISSHCAVISEMDPNRIDPRYLAYVMSSPYGIDTLTSMTSGTSTAMIKVRDICRFPVPLIPLEEQQVLGELYVAFNRKRAVLRQMLTTEKAAQNAVIMDVIQREV